MGYLYKRDDNKLIAKVVTLGDAGVGKTSLIAKATGATYHGMPTIGIDFKTITVDNLHFQIWDTAGQEKFRAITNLYIRDSVVIILVYSVTDLVSFNHLTDWIQVIRGIDETVNHLVLAGNKVDLPEDTHTVDKQVVEKFVIENGLEHFLTSSKDPASIEAVFTYLIETIQQSEQYQNSLAGNQEDADASVQLNQRQTPNGASNCRC